MKNIHILATDKPTWLHKSLLSGVLRKSSSCIDDMKQAQGMNIYITSDEEIKEGDCFLVELFKITGESNGLYIEKCTKLVDVWCNNFDVISTRHKDNCKKIILTTDQDLIKDGVQTIDNEFLEWFVNNPSCEFINVEHNYIDWVIDNYKIIIPKEEPKQETLEEASELALLFHNTYEKLAPSFGYETRLDTKKFDFKSNNGKLMIEVCTEILKWQAERMYSEEEVIDLIQSLSMNEDFNGYGSVSKETANYFLEQFKKK